MIGKATLMVIIGFSMIFAVAGQYWGRSGNAATENFVDYYNQTAARNLAADAANLACDSLFVDPKDTSMSLLYLDGDDSCSITTRTQVVAGRKDCFITAISYYNEGKTRIRDTVQVWMQPIYLNGFAMFSQNENSVNWVTGDVVTGPFATNGKMYVDGAPIFRGRATAVGGIVAGSGGNHAQFLGGFQSGSGVRVNVPTDLSQTASAATAASTFQPTASYSGSSYAYDVNLTFNSNGTVTVTTQNKKYNKYTGTWSTVSSTAAVTDTLSHLANSNGEIVILVKNGDAHVQGTLNGSVTVIAQAGTGTTANRSSSAQTNDGTDYFKSSVSGNVIVEGNMRYNDESPTTDDMLGLVADNSVALDTQPTGSGDITVDAAIFAKNGSWTYLDYDGTTHNKKMGTLNVMGSICQNLRGAVGTESNGKISTGYLKNYTFDNRFVNAAPPSFPQAVGQYQLVSWYE